MNQSTHQTKPAAPVQRGGAARIHPLLRESGMLEFIEADTHRLAIKRGARQAPVVFQWTETTQFQRQGERITPADLREGEQVNILYNKESSHLLAKTIQVRRQHESVSTSFVPEPNPC